MRAIVINPHLHLKSLLGLISALQAVLAQIDLSTYASQPRWGQSSLLLSDNALLVYGGKVMGGGGYTYTSAPDTNDLLYLSFNTSFSNNSPPWQYLSGSQLSSSSSNTASSQPVSYAALGLLVEPTAYSSGSFLAFGGDASSSSNLTNSDSSWLINLPSLASPSQQITPNLITQQNPGWAQQPIRRVRHSANSAMDTDSLRIWVLGGQRADGSQTILDELWQYSAPQNSPQSGLWSVCPTSPQAIFDHSSVTVLDSSDHVRLYVIGGMSTDGKLVDMNKLFRFTPDLTSSSACAGVWDVLNIAGSTNPSARRGHAVVPLSSTQLMLFGGASASGSTVLSDLWILDLDHLSWQQLDGGAGTGVPSARWGHSMTRVGQRVILAFGYASIDNSQPAPGGVAVFDLDTAKWIDSYTPELSSSSDATSSASNQVISPTNAGSGSSASSDAGWQVPGSRNPAKPMTLPQPGSSSDPHSRSSAVTIISVACAILGALALAGGSVYYYRYQKQQNVKRRLAAEEYRRRASGPDFPSEPADDDDQMRLVYQTDSIHATHASFVPGVGGRFENLKPSAFKLLGVGAFWANRRRKERFDMLADEESEIWNATSDTSLAIAHSRAQKELRAQRYLDGFSERVRLPVPTLPMVETTTQATLPLVTTRGGLRIWQGLDEGSQIGFGTSTSFLGASLAPWSDDGRSLLVTETGTYEDPFSDPEDNHHQTACSSPSTFQSELNPFTDPDSEHGTGDDSTGLTRPDTESFPGLALLSPTSTMPPPAVKPLDRRATWWDRLRHGSDATPAVPIRDPAPPPRIAEVVDEHGRQPSGQSEEPGTQTSQRTATSSTIEAVGVEMTVAQRLASGEQSPPLSGCSISPLIGPRPLLVRPGSSVSVRAMVEALEKEKKQAKKVVQVQHGLVKKPVLFVANPDRKIS